MLYTIQSLYSNERCSTFSCCFLQLCTAESRYSRRKHSLRLAKLQERVSGSVDNHIRIMLSDEIHQLGWVECRELVVRLELHTCLLCYVVEALAILATAESEKEALVAHSQRHRLCSAQEVDGVVYFLLKAHSL